MKPVYLIAIAGLFLFCACNFEPTEAAKGNGALNASTPGDWKDGDFPEKNGRTEHSDSETTAAHAEHGDHRSETTH